jgi:hypothetical protein
MTLEKRIQAFVKLGNFLRQFNKNNIAENENILFNELFLEPFSLQIKRAKEFNGWFTDENILFSLEYWSNNLIYSNLIDWISTYPLNTTTPKKVAIIMAGNIPFVGFHDFLSDFVSLHCKFN